MKRISVALVVAALAVAASGCAGADHSWKGEFTARLEGATAVIEESASELRPQSKYLEITETSQELARKLDFRHGLLEKLDPPAPCIPVQEKGEEKVGQLAELSHELSKILTPELQRKLPQIIDEAVTEYRAIEREAETCA